MLGNSGGVVDQCKSCQIRQRLIVRESMDLIELALVLIIGWKNAC